MLWRPQLAVPNASSPSQLLLMSRLSTGRLTRRRRSLSTNARLVAARLAAALQGGAWLLPRAARIMWSCSDDCLRRARRADLRRSPPYLAFLLKRAAEGAPSFLEPMLLSLEIVFLLSFFSSSAMRACEAPGAGREGLGVQGEGVVVNEEGAGQ